jgi:protocatechuate 3,4-dioxygenase beta subunit
MTSGRWAAGGALVSLVIALMPVPGAGQAPAQSSASGMVTGRVVDAATGAAIAGAVVSIGRPASPAGRAPSGSGLAPILSDRDGRFFFRDLSPGAYNVTATKPGFIGGAAERHVPEGPALPIDVGDGQRVRDVTVPLWRYAVISGRVVDEAGEPLPGIDVRAVRLQFGAGRRRAALVLGRAWTDDRGEYRFSTLMPGDYALVVPATVLSEPPGFTGAIRTQGETPRAWFQTMTAVGTAPMSFDRAEAVARTGGSLVSSVNSLPGTPDEGSGAWLTYPSTFHPAATTLGGATIVGAESGRDRSGIDITLRLTPTYEVSGSLTGPDGPAAYHVVHLVRPEDGDMPLFDVATALTDGAGAFAFHGVPPGQYIARVVRTPWPAGEEQRLGIVGGTGAIPSIATFGGRPGMPLPPVPTEPLLHVSQPLAIGERHARDVQLVLQAGPRIRGRAEFDGMAARPAAEQWAQLVVSLQPASGAQYSNVQPGRFTEDGRFQTPSTWPGRYLVRVPSPPAGWTVRSVMYQGREISETPIDLASDLDDVVITFTDRPARIDGVVNDADGRPDRRAVVVLFPVDPAGWTDYGRTSRRVRSALPSRDGRFSFDAPPAGAYFLVAIPDTESADWSNPEVLAALAARAERLEVVEGQTVTRTLRTGRSR